MRIQVITPKDVHLRLHRRDELRSNSSKKPNQESIQDKEIGFRPFSFSYHTRGGCALDLIDQSLADKPLPWALPQPEKTFEISKNSSVWVMLFGGLERNDSCFASYCSHQLLVKTPLEICFPSWEL